MDEQNNNPFDKNFTQDNSTAQQAPQPQAPQFQPQQPQTSQFQAQQPAGFYDPQAQGMYPGNPEFERMRLTGIGGLLMLYVILACLGLLGGLLAIPDLIYSFNIIKTIVFVVAYALSAVGLIFIFMKKRNAVPVNIAALATGIVSWIVEVAIFDPYALDMGSEIYGYEGVAFGMMICFAFVAAIYKVLWIVYFMKSRRVAFTLTK